MLWKCIRFEFVCLCLFVDFACCIRWLGLRNFASDTVHMNQKAQVAPGRSLCHPGLGMSARQTALCGAALDTMPHVARAARLTLDACTRLLEDRRWNCSSAHDAPVLGPDLARGTREQAFMYALGSAAVTLAIARACAAGDLFHCSCAPPPGEPPAGNFKWGGCSDNVRWGALFAKRFLDATERTHVTPDANRRRRRQRRKPGEGRKRMVFRDRFGKMTDEDEITDAKMADEAFGNVTNMRSGMRRRKPEADPDMSKFHTRLAAMNLHNNRIGRKTVQQSQATACKCHGVSGSCSVKTCWRALGALTVAGQKLLRKMEQAVEVAPRRLGTTTRLAAVAPVLPVPLTNQLVFLTKSPDYCNEDPASGSLGTKGRTCSVGASGQSIGSCHHLCCGRGYNTVVEEKVERCHCVYHWCCYVKCKTCITTTQRQECN